MKCKQLMLKYNHLLKFISAMLNRENGFPGTGIWSNIIQLGSLNPIIEYSSLWPRSTPDSSFLLTCTIRSSRLWFKKALPSMWETRIQFLVPGFALVWLLWESEKCGLEFPLAGWLAGYLCAPYPINKKSKIMRKLNVFLFFVIWLS